LQDSKTRPPTGGFFMGLANMQQEIHQVLLQNMGNRLTHELINGLTARIEMIARQAISDALKERDAAPKEGKSDA